MKKVLLYIFVENIESVINNFNLISCGEENDVSNRLFHFPNGLIENIFTLRYINLNFLFPQHAFTCSKLTTETLE